MKIEITIMNKFYGDGDRHEEPDHICLNGRNTTIPNKFKVKLTYSLRTKSCIIDPMSYKIGRMSSTFLD